MIDGTYPTTHRRRFPKRLFVYAAIVAFAVITMPASEQGWLEKNAKRLSALTITPEMISKAGAWYQTEPADGTEWHYSLGGEGVIPIGKDSAVYVVMHSFHAYTPLNFLGSLVFLVIHRGNQRPVSDAILAVDQKGNLYTHEGHVCDGLSLRSDKEVKAIEDFLQTDDWSGHTWKPYVAGQLIDRAAG